MRVALVLVLLFFAKGASAIDASDRYRSPRNPERKIRKSTELIVLHTTEAPARSSLNKLSDRGEAHYCVTEEGRVYRIVDRDKEAFHAGRSMWRGKEDVDKFSIGIECVGYHNKPMGMVQINAIRELVKELQSMYSLSDDKVVCHSHVAYGAPNRWQKHRHRGRKRCGMLFAMPSVRAKLDLKSRPAVDVDVRAKRLTVGDDYLRRVLYGYVDTMKSSYPPDKPRRKDASALMAGLKPKKEDENKKRPPPKSPPPTRAPKTVDELKSMGYVLKGTVTPNRTAGSIAGVRWNSPDTYYVIRNKVVPGNTVNPSHIERGMGIWMKK